MNSEFVYEVIIVGSGPAAVMAAQTLIESGRKVLMLDVGIKRMGSDIAPNQNYLELRQSDNKQYTYLLGRKFESLPSPGISTGAQLTPARKHIHSGVEDYCPIKSSNFFPLESFATGGLGEGWGLGIYSYSDAELNLSGLPCNEMRSAYQKIADRIGISAGQDDLGQIVVNGIDNCLPPLQVDNSIDSMLAKYQKSKDWFKRNNTNFGWASMALLSVDYRDRKATKYHDLDFYENHGYSAWRPEVTLKQLEKSNLFTYQSGVYVLSFLETDGLVEVKGIKTSEGNMVLWKAKKLILTAGALGNARIVLRSQNLSKLPFLCNPYTYMPSINLSMLGKDLSKSKTSMAQAMMIYKPENVEKNTISVAFYTYRSLLLLRLIQQSPLNIKDNRLIFKWMYPAFVIAGIHHPDFGHFERSLRLIKDSSSKTGDALEANFAIDRQTESMNLAGEKFISKALKKMGVFPIKKLNAGYGSSIHYAGTIPFSKTEMHGTSAADGRLHGTSNVFIGDGSSFNFLPAKGITFSLMANAHRVAIKMFSNE